MRRFFTCMYFFSGITHKSFIYKIFQRFAVLIYLDENIFMIPSRNNRSNLLGV